MGGAVANAGADGQPVALPVAGLLAVVATALGAGVDPYGLAPWDHPGPGGVRVAVRTYGSGKKEHTCTHTHAKIYVNKLPCTCLGFWVKCQIHTQYI